MVDLKTLQNRMENAMRHEVDLDQAAQLIKEPKTLSRAERIKIYHGSITSIFINTLKSTFPVCQKLVGRKFFSAMSFEYVQQKDSHSPDLNDYGDDYPQFIANFEHAQELPYLSDVAQLEWYWHRLNLIAPTQPVDLQPIADLSEEQLAQVIFKLPNQAFLFRSIYPIHDIWVANSDDIDDDHIVEIDSSTPLPNQNTPTSEVFSEQLKTPVIDLNSGGVNLILLRDQDGLRMDQLPDNLYFLLSEFAQKQSFGAVAENYVAKNFDEPFDQAFATCCQQDWIADFSKI